MNHPEKVLERLVSILNGMANGLGKSAIGKIFAEIGEETTVAHSMLIIYKLNLLLKQKEPLKVGNKFGG